MLYLEDFLEMIENLPIELRDKLIEMRELDLQVSNSADGLRERVNIFFKKCVSGSVTQEWTDEQMEKFRQEYAKVLEDADEKVQLANQSYELVERHMRKLDQEISKFKMELEADNPGITEIIERRVTESERTAPQILNNNHRSEKKKHTSLAHDVILGRHFSQANSSMIDRLASQSSLAAELIKESPTPVGTPNSNKSISSGVNVASSLNSITCDTPQQKVPTLSCNLGGSGSNAAIAVAASRAIGATVEMQQGRRTASLKASYEAVKQIPKVLPLGKEIQTHTKNVNPEMKSNNKNKKHGTGSLQNKAGGSIQHSLSVVETQPALDPNVVNEDGSELTASGWQADPNEPRYCICNDVSYGDMVGCDNEDCPLEWFHYGCVGLQQAPRGKWYCPQCATSMKRRGRK